jgi:hypothetical protein
MKQILELTALSCNALANEAEEHLNEIVKAYYKSIVHEGNKLVLKK